MFIEFEEVSIQNFLSTGNIPLVIQLNRHRITTIIASNGSGKSQIIDAIFFALYGKPYRAIKKAQIINSVNERGTLVEIKFKKGSDSYIIKRGIKPDLFEIYKNNAPFDQMAANKDYQAYLETYILGMNAKTFKQTVILSVTNYIPFMTLSAADRRNVIEDLLDIQVFSYMNELLADRKKENTSNKDKTKNTISLLEVEIKGELSKLDSLLKKDSKLIDENTDNIKKAEAEIDTLRVKIEELESARSDLTELNSIFNDLNEKLSKSSNMLSRLKGSHADAVSKRDFYSNNCKCPTCQQDIDDAFKDTLFKQIESDIESKDRGILAFTTKYNEIRNSIYEVQAKINEVNSINKSINDLSTEMRHKTYLIRSLNEQIRSYIKSSDLEVDSISANISTLQDKLNTLNSEYSTLLLNEEVYLACSKLLKDDGIKAKVIESYLPTINKVLNHYLDQFNFSVSWHFDSSWNESIRSRYRDIFSYSSFSSGERARLDICIVLTFREIAKLKNSVSTNLLFLDEICENMDSVGIDRIMDLLNNISNSNVFVVTHKQEIQEKVEHKIHLNKDQGFTVLVGE